MIKLHLEGTDVAHDAVNWCMKKFSNTDWDVTMSNRGWGIYKFEFNKKQDATLFSLAWAEYTSRH